MMLEVIADYSYLPMLFQLCGLGFVFGLALPFMGWVVGSLFSVIRKFTH